MGKYYFLADAHIGTKIVLNTEEHEKKLVEWLEMARQDANGIFLVGDIFDFWFEYKHCIPNGYDRLLGKLAEITDSGIPVHFFIGNHDLWTFGYLEAKIGLIVHKTPQLFILNDKKFFIAHGDGIGFENNRTSFMKWVFHKRFLQKCFSYLNPNIGIAIGRYWSNQNRLKHQYDCDYKGDNKEPVMIFAKNFCKNNDIDYFVFGHRHILLNKQISEQSRLVILGDFYREFSYAVFDENELQIMNYKL